MGRITGINTIKSVMEKYASNAAEFFSLKDDGEVARVRFLHKDDNDLDVFVVHKVKLNGKDRYVECLAETGKCPFCEAGLKPMLRGFFQLIDKRDGKRKLWDRGKMEITSILGLIGRYGSLDSRDFEIQRNGKKGDNKTTYQFFPLDPAPEKYEPREEICGPDKFILQKTYEEMKQMLNEIEFDNVTPQQNQGRPTGKMF